MSNYFLLTNGIESTTFLLLSPLTIQLITYLLKIGLAVNGEGIERYVVGSNLPLTKTID